MRFKNKAKFQRLIRRYDGDGAGGSSTTATTAVGGTTATTATTATTTTAAAATDTGAQAAQPFKAFASESEYQKDIDFKIQQALKTHEEKLKGKLTPEIRAQLEKEATMTADQKVQAQLEALESDKKALAKEKSRIKAESLFASKGIGEAERAVMLDSVVTEDAEQSVKSAQALIDAIEAATNEKIKAAMKDVKAPNSTAATSTQTQETMGKILGKQYAAASSVSQKTVDYYKLGGKR